MSRIWERRREKFPKIFLKAEDIEIEKVSEPWMNPVDGIITSSCGVRKNPILGQWEYHNGIDIAVAENTKAAAVRSGKVTEIRYSNTLGNVLKFETEDGFTIMYAHLNKVMVKEGKKVKRGEIVAKTGNTGLSTGPHLHYSVWKGDMLMNPMQFVDLNYTDEVRAEFAARGVADH